MTYDSRLDNLEKRCERLEERLEDLGAIQTIFDMQWEADMRAIKKWQEATGRETTWPDHCNLVVWLLGELDKK